MSIPDRKTSIPARAYDFLVGRDSAGRWLAVETHGLAGGIFASRDAAMRYATAETGRRPKAVRLSRRRIALAI